MPWALVSDGAVVQKQTSESPGFIEIPDDVVCGFVLVDGAFVAPPPAPKGVPQTVTRRQARQALLLAGKLALVQPAIDAMPDATQRGMMQIEWDDSLEFQRNRPSLIAMGTAIGLDSAGIDALFVEAAKL